MTDLKLFPYPIRLVVLDYPIKHWQDPAVQSMFCKVTDLKLRGYWTKHGHDSVVPVDVSDLIGANIATCYVTPNGLVPIMAFRMLASGRCEAHRNRFPALSVLESSAQSTANLEKILATAKQAGREVVYGSSWTRDEMLPKNPEVRAFLRDLHTTNMMNFMRSRGIQEFVACGVLRFKIHEYLEDIGMHRISPDFAQYSVFDQVVAMYHIGDVLHFSPDSHALRTEFSAYWSQRLELGEGAKAESDAEEFSENEKKRAA